MLKRFRESTKPAVETACATSLDQWFAEWVGQAVSPGVSSSDVHSGGESPLWTVVTGTIRLSKGARREAGSEESR